MTTQTHLSLCLQKTTNLTLPSPRSVLHSSSRPSQDRLDLGRVPSSKGHLPLLLNISWETCPFQALEEKHNDQ